MTSGAIDILDVSHGFFPHEEPLIVLDGVSLSAKAGEFIALLGPSGCGKSTLLRLVAGLERPLFGSIYVGGERVHAPDPSRALVFQDPTLFPWRTVRQNLEIGPDAMGRRKADRPRVDRALELVHLTEFQHSLPSQLSGGMAQRAALARALVVEPTVFLFDEPLGKLDALTRSQLQHELGDLWHNQGFTALLVTHDVSEALFLADRIAVFSPRPGHIVSEVVVNLPRPRIPQSAEFLVLQAKILSLLTNGADTGDSTHQR